MRAPLTALLSLLLVSLVACSGERSSETGRNLGSKDQDAGDIEGDAQQADAESDPDALPDAGALEEDAALDGASAPDAAGPFSITVRRGQVPVVGARVWFHDASGALTEQHLTGDDGRVVSADTPAMVTALAVDEAGAPAETAYPFTFTAVAPGDQLVLELPAGRGRGNSTRAYAVTLPAFSPNEYVEVMAGHNGCTVSDGTPGTEAISLYWPADCARGQNNAILALLYGGDEIRGYAFEKSAPAFGNEALEVTLGAWLAPTGVRVEVANVPATTTLQLSLGAWASGARFRTDLSSYAYLPDLGDGAVRSHSFPVPEGFADELELHLSSEGSIMFQYSDMIVRQAPASTVSLDFATRLAGATGGQHATATVGRPSFSWQTGPTTTPADAVVTTLAWYTRVAGAEVRRTWYLIGPGDAQTFTLPEIEPGLFQSFGFNRPVASVSHFASSLDDGYRAFLSHPIRPLMLDVDGGRPHPLAVDLPAAGSLQAFTWFEWLRRI